MVSAKTAIFVQTIREVLIQAEGYTLNYSPLYSRVNNHLRRNEQLRHIKKEGEYALSTRDFTKTLNIMMAEGSIQRLEDSQSKKKIKPVYFVLTENGKGDYQRDFLGTPVDQSIDRRRKLWQLLFFYEAIRAGRISVHGEDDFDEFLRSVFVSRDDLRIAKRRDEDGDDFIIFEPIKDIRISRLEGSGPPGTLLREQLGNRREVVYGITLPGFTLNEIWMYYKRNRNSPLNPEVLGHLKFRYEEVKEIFDSLKDAGLIKPFFKFGNGSEASARDIRYIITDAKLKELASRVWELMGEKIALLSLRHSLGEFDVGRNRQWLVEMFGEENTENMIKEWVHLHKYHRNRKPEREGDQQEEISKLALGIEENEYNMRARILIRNYRRILDKYQFLSNLIYEMLL